MTFKFAVRKRVPTNNSVVNKSTKLENGNFIRSTDVMEYGEFSKFKNVSGVYEIICIITNKTYVGSTTLLDKRLTKHFSELRFNRHTNSAMQKDFNLHGFTNFKYNLVKAVDIDDLLITETDYLKSKNIDDLYNEKITGIYLSDNLKSRAANASRETHKTKEYSVKMSNILSKYSILQFDIYGKFIKKFDRMDDVISQYPEYKPQPIRGVCNGSKQTYKGYIWKYAVIE